MPARPLPDREYLMRAFNRIRPFYWGDDLDVALAHPIRGIAIAAVARRIQRQDGQPSEKKTPELQRKKHAVPRSEPTRMDFKRLASGEREDD